MDHPPPRCHPLDGTVRQKSLMSGGILVAELTLEHVGYRLESAVGMRRKAAAITCRIIILEFVQQQKRIEDVQFG